MITLDGTLGITSPAETVQGALTTTGNTILGDAATDTLNVGNGGLVKDASGNVGVGTASPTAKFHVYAAASTDAKTIVGALTATNSAYTAFVNTTVTTVGTENSTGGNLVIGSSAYSTVLANNGAYPISFGTNNTERMRIDSSGRVTTPYQTAFQGYRTSNSAVGIQTGYTASLNVGSNFSASTGRFTAPVAGTYMFAFSTLGSIPGSSSDIYLFINGLQRGDVMSIRPCGTNTSQPYTPLASNTGLVALSVSDYVEISSAQGLYSDSNIWQHFSGYLLG